MLALSTSWLESFDIRQIKPYYPLNPPQRARHNPHQLYQPLKLRNRIKFMRSKREAGKANGGDSPDKNILGFDIEEWIISRLGWENQLEFSNGVH